jgi:cadmium resistance protein CadD (predicted permease)
MDEFLMGSTVLVFASLLVVVLTSSLANRGQLERSRRIDRRSRWLFPLVFLLLSFHAFVL